MTTIKETIDNLLKNIVNPQLEAISEKLARLEPYTFQSEIRNDLVKVLNEITSLHDYIKAIGDGNEETTKEELETLFRIISSKAVSGGMVNEQRISPVMPPAAQDNGISLYINGISYSSATPTIIRPFHTYDFTVQYNEPAKLITFSLDGLTLSEVGNSLYVDNFFVRTATVGTKTITVNVTKEDDTVVSGEFTLTIQNS